MRLSRTSGWQWWCGGALIMFLVVGLAPISARAQSITQELSQTFELHGYIENQDIMRAENFVKGYNLASFRNRIDLEPSGRIVENVNSIPYLHDLSIGFFADIRPEYEGAYDLNPDRFGDRSTGFSGQLLNSPFFPVPQYTGPLSNGLIQAAGLNLKRFAYYGEHDFGFPVPVSNSMSMWLTSRCRNCINVNVPTSDLRWARDDSNMYYYPLREGYFDVHFNALGGENLVRIGKQQIVWGKADFFRLQDIVNPVDYGQHFFIESFDDTRIPELALWWQHRFGDVGFLRDLTSNFVWNFDHFWPVGLGQGGQPWAVAFGWAKKSFPFSTSLFTWGLCQGAAAGSHCNQNYLNFALTSEHVPNWSIRNSGVGMKWDFQIPQGVRFALTDYYGIRDTPVFGFAPYINLFNPMSSACASMASPTGGVPVTMGPAVGGLSILAVRPSNIHLKPGVSAARYLNQCAFGAGFNIFYHKVNTLGLSADYFEPHTGVVIRLESSWTADALLDDTSTITEMTHNDILQYVLGFDYVGFIKFLNPERTFFSSFQIFETYYPGGHSSDGGRTGLITGANDFTFTAFTQTHYYRDQVIPLIFGAFGTQGTDATIGGNVEYLLSNHWSAQIGADAFLGKYMTTNDGPFAAFHGGIPFSESIFAAARDQAGGAERNKMDEFWLRVRYRF